jgi:hypothetical protein
MSEAQALIPPPGVVREKLAQSVREAQWLRSLLRLSVRAAEERHRVEQAQRTTGTAPQLEAAAR